MISFAVAPLVGCTANGPGRIQPDRFDYNQSISDSNQEQMLLNTVRMRYADVPTFLEVSSVLTQYVYSGRVGVSGALVEPEGDNIGASGAYTYLERPTITYSPMTGQDFTDQLLTPIPSGLFFALVQSGWPADELMLMGVERINDVVNLPFDSKSRSTPSRPETFRKVIELMLELAARGALEIQDGPKSEVRTLVFAEDVRPEVGERLAELRNLLDLDPSLMQFRLTERRLRRPDEITIQIRSLLALMNFLSLGVDIPDAHGSLELPALSTDMRGIIPLRIHSSTEPPGDEGFVSVEYLGHWYYVAKVDRASREAFGLLNYLFLMMAPRAQSAAPLITVPT